MGSKKQRLLELEKKDHVKEMELTLEQIKAIEKANPSQAAQDISPHHRGYAEISGRVAVALQPGAPPPGIPKNGEEID